MNSFTYTFRNIHQRIGDVKVLFELPAAALTQKSDHQLMIFSWRNLVRIDPSYDDFVRSVKIVAQKPVSTEKDSSADDDTAFAPGFSAAAPPPLVDDHTFSQDVNELVDAMVRTRAMDEAVVHQRRNSFEQDFRFVFGYTERSQKLLFELTVNTDSPTFLAWTNINPDRRMSIQGLSNSDVFKLIINVESFASTPPASGIPYCQRGIVDLRLEPCQPLAKYKGFVAFDFGNNSSTVAYLPDTAGGARNLRQMNLDEKDMKPSGQPSLDSKIRMLTYQAPLLEHDPGGERGLFGTADYLVGEVAQIRTEGTLIEGLKPLLGDPNEEPPLEVELINGQQVMPKGIAAELFLTEMFRSFHRQELALAAPVALTYPTTYSRREISRLWNAVTRAFQRSILKKNLAPAQLADLSRKTVGLLVDEATAAAFYYLYRDFLDGPGKTAALKYLYPQGVNLLLYDCGGGTTDIALVHAMPTLAQVVDDEGRMRETWRVRMSVLGRTGHRTFGGDNITAAMTVAVKWLIVSEIVKDFPKPDADLCDRRLDSLRERMNVVLPTSWTIAGEIDRSLTPLILRGRKAATRQMVKFAEDAKIWISDQATSTSSEVPVAVEPPDLPSNTELERIISAACQGDRRRVSSVFSGVKRNLLSLRPVVDAIIDADVRLSIKAANSLIRNRLTAPTGGDDASTPDPSASLSLDCGERDEFGTADSDGPPRLAADSCVHWVYVVGKASQYPTIVEHLQNRLWVSDLKPSGPSNSTVHRDTADRNGADRVGDDRVGDDRVGDDRNGDDRNGDDQGLPTRRLVLEKEMLKGAVARGAVLLRMFSKDTQDVVVQYDKNLSAKLAFEMGIFSAGRGMKPMFRADEFYSELKPFDYEAAGGAKDGQTLRVFRRWPGMEGCNEDDGWEEYLQFAFRSLPLGTITIEYEESKPGGGESSFVATVQNTGDRVRGTEVATKMFQSPLQRGDL